MKNFILRWLTSSICHCILLSLCNISLSSYHCFSLVLYVSSFCWFFLSLRTACSSYQLFLLALPIIALPRFFISLLVCRLFLSLLSPLLMSLSFLLTQFSWKLKPFIVVAVVVVARLALPNIIISPYYNISLLYFAMIGRAISIKV